MTQESQAGNTREASSDVKLLRPPEHPPSAAASAGHAVLCPTANSQAKTQQNTAGGKKAPEAGKGGHRSFPPGLIFILYVATCMEVEERGRSCHLEELMGSPWKPDCPHVARVLPAPAAPHMGRVSSLFNILSLERSPSQPECKMRCSSFFHLKGKVVLTFCWTPGGGDGARGLRPSCSSLLVQFWDS